jgi:hypothetical protein
MARYCKKPSQKQIYRCVWIFALKMVLSNLVSNESCSYRCENDFRLLNCMISVENNGFYKLNFSYIIYAPSRRKYIGRAQNRQQSYSMEL